MPTYDLINEETGEELEVFMTISAKEEYLEKNPHIRQKVSAPAIVGGVRSVEKGPDNTWGEVVQKIASHHPASPLADRVLKKSIAQVKTEQILDKHKKKSANKKLVQSEKIR